MGSEKRGRNHVEDGSFLDYERREHIVLPKDDEEYVTVIKVVAIAHLLTYSYTSNLHLSSHALGPPLVGQWVHPLPLQLDANLVL